MHRLNRNEGGVFPMLTNGTNGGGYRQDPPQLRILLVDDQVLNCEALATMFSQVERMRIVATATDVREALTLAADLHPDVVVTDAQLPDRGAFRCARDLLGILPSARSVFLDDEISVSRLREALAIGVAGYLLRSTPFRLLAASLARVAQRQQVFSPEIEDLLVVTPSGFLIKSTETELSLAALTTRETEVLCFLAEGMSVKECARRLHLAHSTVDNHKSRLMKKLNVHKSTELTRLAIREGLISV
ncbi:MAG: response regulator transcription factor [Pirellulales bacterium]